MAEGQSKARQVVEHLYRSAAAREPDKGPDRPRLQLRRDMPTVEISETTPVVDALAQLQTEHVGTLALRAAGGDAKAIVLSVERYLEFVGQELERHAPGVVSNGRTMLTDAGLKALHVEQIDPTEPWETFPTQLG